jgi:hypothetical protein
MGEQPQFWFNVRTGQVQTNYDKGQGKDLLGPYPTAEAAQDALRSAAERTERWDEEERSWRDGEED